MTAKHTFKPYIHVVAAILTRGDQFLIAQRAQGRYAGFWEFPGGKVETHETPMVALARELFEELDLSITQAEVFCCYGYSYPEFNVDLSFFKVGLPEESGELISQVHQALAWVRPETVDRYTLLPSNEEVLRRLKGV